MKATKRTHHGARPSAGSPVCFHNFSVCVFCWGSTGRPAALKKPKPLKCAACGRNKPKNRSHCRTCARCHDRGFFPPTMDEAWIAHILFEILAALR